MTDVTLGEREVREIDGTLLDLVERPEPFNLSFANHWPDDDESAALLGAALLGSLASKNIEVDAVDEEAVDGLLRFGVASALARRPEELTRFVGLTERLDPSRLRTFWTPASSEATGALFAERDPDRTGAYGPRHATFVNPHLSSDADGYPDVVFLIRRWLTRRLPERQEGIADEDLRSVVDAVGGAVEETVRNVQEHAAGPDRPAPDCLLRISLETAGLVRYSIFDTGVGLAASLTEKLAGGKVEVEADLSTEDLVAKLLDGELEGWDAGRGTGLAYIATRIGGHGGRITLATDEVRVRRTEEGTERNADGFPLQGTVVDITVAIPPGRG